MDSIRTIEIEYVNIADLKPAEYNPRLMSGDMLEKLKKGLRAFGFVDPIVINQDNTIIGGHQRLTAAIHLGWDKAPCVRLDLDKKKEKALNLSLNKLSGEWDYVKLSSILTEFEADKDFDIELTGFDAIEAVSMMDIGGLDALDLSGDGGRPPEDGGETRDKGYVISYTIVFGSETEQDAWHQYLKGLKEKFPEMETIAERIVHDIANR